MVEFFVAEETNHYECLIRWLGYLRIQVPDPKARLMFLFHMELDGLNGSLELQVERSDQRWGPSVSRKQLSPSHQNVEHKHIAGYTR